MNGCTPISTRFASPAHPKTFDRVTVIGAGAWGTALAIVACRAGRRNLRYLPAAPLPPALTIHHDLDEALRSAELVVLAVPSYAVEAACARLAPSLAPATPVLICAKGIDGTTGRLLTDVVELALPGHEAALLSGPSFADEVAAGLPTSVVIAGVDAARRSPVSVAARIANTFRTRTFHPHVTDDVVGVAVGGAVKNVLAIASGVAAGLELGVNARAAIITRGLAEMRHLTVALGGHEQTAAGLAGIGDVYLTCSSEQSRNLRFGMNLARGSHGDRSAGVVEGAAAAAAITDLARTHGVAMPICEAVRGMLDGTFSVRAAMDRALTPGAEPTPLLRRRAHTAGTAADSDISAGARMGASGA